MFFDAREIPKVSRNDLKCILNEFRDYHFYQNFDVILRRGDCHILACPGLSCPCPVLFCFSFICLKLSWLDSSLSCSVLSMFMAVFTKGYLLSTWHVCLKLKIPYHLKMSGNMFFDVFWCQGDPKSILEWSWINFEWIQELSFLSKFWRHAYVH